MDDPNNQKMEETTNKQPQKTNGKILLTVLLVLLAMASVSCWFIYHVAQSEAYSRYFGIKNVSSERIAKIIRGAEMNAYNIFDEVNQNLDNPESVITALRSKADLNLDVRGYFAAFEPNYFPEKGTWFEPYIYQPEYGGYEFRQVGSARHNYTKSPWYVRAKENSLSFWSDPYYYYDGTSMSGYYVTFVKPLYNVKGDLACVCGADIKFSWLAKELEWIDENSKTNKMLNKYQTTTDFDYYTIILDSDGTCLTHPEEKNITITDQDVLKHLAQKKAGIADLDIDGKSCTMYYGPIEFIDWSVAVIVPKHDFVKPMLPTVLILLSMVVIGMIIVWFVCKR